MSPAAKPAPHSNAPSPRNWRFSPRSSGGLTKLRSDGQSGRRSEKSANFGGDGVDVGFKRKVTGIEHHNSRIGNIAAERLRTGRDEEQIVRPPGCKKTRPVFPEESLIKRIALYIPLVVELQIDLQIGIAGPGKNGGIQRVGFRLDRVWVGNALEIGRL